MSDRRKSAAKAIEHARQGLQSADSFQNFVAKVGIGTGNQHDGATYGFNPLTRLRVKLEWMYRGSWVCGVAVDCVADDMTRAGVDITSEMDPKKIQLLEREVARLGIWPSLNETIKWSRLFGGSLAYLMIEGQHPSTPLRVETIQKGQFKGIMPLDRWMVNPSLGELVGEYGPNFGLPMYYTTLPDTRNMPILKIHHSRCIRFEGIKMPYFQRQTEQLWGISIIERLFDRLVAYDSTTAGATQLVYKAHLRTLKVEGLREIIGMGGDAMAGLAKNVEMIRALQSNEGLTLLDLKDEFETHQYTFSGLDDLLEKMGDQVSGALQVPKVRLFGQSPGGLNSTGDADFRTYYDSINQQQVKALGPGIETLYAAAHMNKFGTMPPEDFVTDFKSLWELTDDQAADVVNKVTAAVQAVTDSNIIRRSTALKELKQMSRATGVFSNISQEEIDEAENDPAPSPEMLGLVAPPPPTGPGSGQGSGAGGKTKKPTG